MRDCPKKKACNTMFKETGEKQLEVPPIEAADTGCFRFFNALNAKQLPAKVQDKSLMHVEATINSKRAQALIDTGTSHNFIKVDKAKWLGLKVKKTNGWLKTVN